MFKNCSTFFSPIQWKKKFLFSLWMQKNYLNWKNKFVSGCKNNEEIFSPIVWSWLEKKCLYFLINIWIYFFLVEHLVVILTCGFYGDHKIKVKIVMYKKNRNDTNLYFLTPSAILLFWICALHCFHFSLNIT